MTRLRFSMGTLMLSVTAIAVASALLPDPQVAFYAVLVCFFVAAILSRAGPRKARGFWFWFSLCGWIYIVAGMSLLEVFERTALWNAVQSWLQNNVTDSANGEWCPVHWTPQHFLMLGHSLVAIIIALAGALFLPKSFPDAPETDDQLSHHERDELHEKSK